MDITVKLRLSDDCFCGGSAFFMALPFYGVTVPENIQCALDALALQVGVDEQPDLPLHVALSGGLDSTALLLGLVKHSKFRQQNIHAVYVNHGLSSNADAWQAHCEALAANLGVRFTALQVEIDSSRGNIEAQAREARYTALAHCVGKGVVLTAHHQNDQAETVLLRLLRGAGVRGMSAMAGERVLSEGVSSHGGSSEKGLSKSETVRLLRPLLSCSRSELEVFVKSHSLAWIEDESNQDARFNRNFLRNHIFPLIEQKWPKVHERLCTSAKHMATAASLLDEYASEDLMAIGVKSERLGRSVRLSPQNGLYQFSSARRIQVIRTLITDMGLPQPDEARLDEIEKLCMAREDACPAVEFHHSNKPYSVRRFRERLYVVPETGVMLPSNGRVEPILWSGSKPLLLPNGSMLESPHAFSQPVEVGLRTPFLREQQPSGKAERCKPVGRKHSQTLKKLLQEYALEPWLRDAVPVLRLKSEVLAVGDLWVCEAGQKLGCTDLSWTLYDRSGSPISN